MLREISWAAVIGHGIGIILIVVGILAISRNRSISWRKILLEALGGYGLAATLSAYGLISAGVVNSSNVAYHLLNLTGAVTVATVVWRKRAWPLVVLNLVWMAIAVFALARIVLK